MIITLEQVKQNLNIESDFLDDDAFINELIEVAELSVMNYLNFESGYTGYTTNLDTPTTVIRSMILIASHLYLNRQIISFGQGYEIPYTFQFLLASYRIPSIT